MKLVLHIFRKDTRHFRWEIISTVAVLACLTWADSWRSDFTPGSMEGWLNILLPFAWSYLIALAILEDPLVGDRQFWVPLPCGWQTILTAKALFVVLFVHLPYLISCGVVLGARGFSPFSYVPQLFGKQLLLLICLTLPAAALAAVVKNVVQFVLAGIVLGAGAILMFGVWPMNSAPWIPVDHARNALPLSVLTAGAVAVVCIQYVRRGTALARIAGAGAVLASAMIYAWVPRPSTLELQCALDSRKPAGEPISIRYAPGEVQPANLHGRMPSSRERITLAIPVAMSGLTAETRVYANQLTVEMNTTEGGHYRATLPSSYREYEKLPLVGFLELGGPGRARQLLLMKRTLFDQIKGSRVTIRGTVKADFHTAEAPVTVPIGGRAFASRLGICSSALVDFRPGEDGLKVVCESPIDIPLGGAVTLVAANQQSWGERLGFAMTSVTYPRNTWLSPLNRRDAFFHLTAEDVSRQEGRHWLAPVSAVTGGHILVMPERTSCDLISYELPGINLSDYLVK